MLRPRILILIGAVVAIATAAFATRGIAPPTPTPAGTFSFAALGDAPYAAMHGETLQYRLVLQELEAHDLSLVLHVGDIFWYPCSDERYTRTLDEFNALRHPVVYTPGDNEWADCWEDVTGGFKPLDRLAKIREIFFATPSRSLGGQPIPLVSQSGEEAFSEFVENARWTHNGVLFVTVNLPGSRNARDSFPGRTAADDQESKRRTDADTAWLGEAFAAARESSAAAVVVAFHANADLEDPPTKKYRQNYEPFLTKLEEEAERFGKPVLVVHGDGHEYTVDHPIVRRTTGRRLENVTRVQVPGSPDIGWVRVVVTPGPQPRFSFENRVVPKWKYW